MKIIAEIGSVHDGSFGNACKLIEAAASCGADTVKFQTHIAQAETLADAPAPSYFKGEPRMDYFQRTAFSIEEWQQLIAHARQCKVNFLSSPFSLEAVDLLENLGISAYKIPSGEVSNLPLLERVAATGKPVLLSSGMSDWRELDAAVEILKSADIVVMQCSSLYPCPAGKVGLNVLLEMASRYQTPVGFSDHTMGLAAAVAAAALGAVVIEKHFTFSRLMYGSDARHSSEPVEFRAMAKALHEVWEMLDNPVNKGDSSPFSQMKMIFEKSIVAACDIKAETIIERSHLAFKKPGDGIAAAQYSRIIGRKTARDINADHKFQEGDFV